MQHQEGTAYVTGTADVAEGERRQRLGMGALSCRQGQHTQVSAPHEVGCGVWHLFRGGEGSVSLKPRKWSMLVMPSGEGGVERLYHESISAPYQKAQAESPMLHGENVQILLS